MDEIAVLGVIKKTSTNYVIVTDDGKEYRLSAILPWEAISPDYNTYEFELNLGKRISVSGVTNGHTIYRASLSEINE